MSRIIVFSLALTVIHGTRAQHFQPVFDDRLSLNPGWPQELMVAGHADYNANTVYNELPWAIYNGEQLERDLRRRSGDALSPTRNTLGYALEARVEWHGPRCLNWAPDWRPVVAVALHDLSGVRFTKDQFEIAFFGNGAYEERTAIMAPSSYQRIGYQTLGGGLMHAASRSFIRLDIVRGASFATADVDWGSLYTGTDGTVLRSALLGNYAASDTADLSWDRTPGKGIALSARWNFETRTGRPLRFSFGVDDLGFIAWNGNTVHIQKDTLITYTGWEVQNLFALDDVIVNEETVLDTFGLRYTVKERTRIMPFRLSASMTRTLNAHWLVGFGLEHRHLPGYIPQGTLLFSRFIGTRTTLGATLGYGGFGGLRIGLSAQRRFGDHVLLRLSTPQVAGFVSGRARGLGAQFAVDFAF